MGQLSQDAGTKEQPSPDTGMKEQPSPDTGTKEQLLQIAARFFAQQGYRQTKISDIVKQAGVSQGTFYWHFKSKEAVALEIIDAGKQRLLEVIQQGYRQQQAEVQDMVKASAHLFEGIFDFSRNNPYLMEILLTGSGGDEAIRQAAFETRIAVEDAFRRNMARAVELGMLPRTANVDVRAALLVSMLEGLIGRWLFGPLHPQSSIQELSVQALAMETAQFEFYGLLGV